MNAIKLLKQLSHEAKRKEYPSFPEAYIPETIYTDKTANGLQKCIKDFLNLSGHQAERVNTMGVYIPGKITDHGHLAQEVTQGRYRKTAATKGSSDIHSTINLKTKIGPIGISVKWEVKIGKDTVKQKQIEYGESVKKAGGLYFIVSSFDQFHEYYLEILEYYEKL